MWPPQLIVNNKFPGEGVQVTAYLPVELYPELGLECVHLVGWDGVDLPVRVLQDRVPPNLQTR